MRLPTLSDNCNLLKFQSVSLERSTMKRHHFFLQAIVMVLLLHVTTMFVQHLFDQLSKVSNDDILELEYYTFRNYNYLDGVSLDRWLASTPEQRQQLIEWTTEAR